MMINVSASIVLTAYSVAIVSHALTALSCACRPARGPARRSQRLGANSVGAQSRLLLVAGAADGVRHFAQRIVDGEAARLLNGRKVFERRRELSGDRLRRVDQVGVV